MVTNHTEGENTVLYQQKRDPAGDQNKDLLNTSQMLLPLSYIATKPASTCNSLRHGWGGCEIEGLRWDIATL